jgi:RES domain-containing protein
MRHVFVLPSHLVLSKLLSVALSFALVGLEAAPAFAGNDNDYRSNSFSTSYGSQAGYSAQSFDFQIQRMSARVQSFVAPPVQYFNPSQFSAPKLNLTYQPTIKFQYSPSFKAPEFSAKPSVKIESFTPVQKPTFMENVGQAFKNIGSAITSAFKKIGDGFVSMAHKIFGTNQKQEVPITSQSQDLMGSYKNLKEIAPGILQTQNGKTHALGQIWEPGSTFKAEGKAIRLIEGTAYGPNFGGITSANGTNLPIRYADDAGKVKPIGLDFTQMPKGLELKILAPVNIEGFGTIMGGGMVFKEPIKTPEGTLGKFQFQGAQVQLDSNMASVLEVTSPANLAGATFMVEAAVMQLKSAVVERGDERIFVSQNHAPMEISGLEKEVNSLADSSSANFSKISTIERDLSARSSAVGHFFKNTSQQTGLDATLNFEFKDEFTDLVKEAGDIRQGSLNLSQSIENESYSTVKEPLQNLQQRQEALTQKIAGLEAQAEPFRELQRGMRGVTNELVSMLPKIDADRLKTEAPMTDQELSFRATKYFPDQKAVVCQQTDKALEGIKSLVNEGAMTPEQGANLGAQMMAMRDKILGAVPNDAFYDQKRAVADSLEKTYDTSKNLVNRTTDIAFFKVMGMEKLAENYPKTGESVGKFFLKEAEIAQTGAAVIGVAGTGYFLVTATITTSAAIGSLYGVKKALEYIGVSKEASTFYAGAVSFLVAITVGNIKAVKSAESWIPKAILSKTQSAWGAVRNVFSGSKRLVMNEGGFVVNPTVNRAIVETKNIGANATVAEPGIVGLPNGVVFEGTIYRAVKPKYAGIAWKVSAENFGARHRYSDVGQGALYSGTSKEAVLGELKHYQVNPVSRAIVSKALKVENILDLTNPATRKALGVSFKDIARDEYLIPQALGDFSRGRYNGILVPSARKPGTSHLILFEGLDH